MKTSLGDINSILFKIKDHVLFQGDMVEKLQNSLTTFKNLLHNQWVTLNFIADSNYFLNYTMAFSVFLKRHANGNIRRYCLNYHSNNKNGTVIR